MLECLKEYTLEVCFNTLLYSILGSFSAGDFRNHLSRCFLIVDWDFPEPLKSSLASSPGGLLVSGSSFGRPSLGGGGDPKQTLSPAPPVQLRDLQVWSTSAHLFRVLESNDGRKVHCVLF